MTSVGLGNTEEGLIALTEFKKIIGVETDDDVLCNGYAILRWAVQEIQRGRKVCSVDETARTYKEFRLPVFDNVESTIGK